MDISFRNRKLRLNVFNSFQGPQVDCCFKINVLENKTEKASLSRDPLHECLAYFNVDAFDIDEYIDEVNNFIDMPYSLATPPSIEKYGTLPDLSNTSLASSLLSALELELLPDAQNNDLLGPNDTSRTTTIKDYIAFDLTPDQEM